MVLHYDENLVESAVLLCAAGKRADIPALHIRRFQREREKLYRVLDPDERNTAFFDLHLEWFREWGLEKVISAPLQDFPLVSRELKVLGIRKITQAKEEGAELYVNDRGERHGIIALRAGLLLEQGCADYLRHEFTHLHDMVDPAFGYEPGLHLPGFNPAQQRLARERYRLLWDITIDSRLIRKGRTPMQSREQHQAAFQKAYSFWEVDKQSRVFTQLSDNPQPTHAALAALIADPRGLRECHEPVPGASCPLCGFPTFDWADARGLPENILGQIQREFPAWTSRQGLCGRCLETYLALANSRPEAGILI